MWVMTATCIDLESAAEHSGFCVGGSPIGIYSNLQYHQYLKVRYEYCTV